ncbi:MAG: hypothetical protein AVDCRST_MAG86-2216 [uncultured Truepera sp.]|uniref:Uncharacterized protein n=1 Tax=uncultured Truepera sp. TaxID=543023 RepID=A0A6J4VKJ1_9DEIN|nr:MAG: hypothetical protein AVDCRST_MAG86-2216 [uncultured Truepera sp.]
MATTGALASTRHKIASTSKVSLIIERSHYRRAKHYPEGYRVRDYQVESLENDNVRLTLERSHAANLVASLPAGAAKVER